MAKTYSISQDDLIIVVDYIVPLEKYGDVYDGYCPFCTTQAEPSFIYDQKNMQWRCSNCGLTGNVVDLVGRYNNVSEEEAKKIIKETVMLSHNKKNVNTSNAVNSVINKISSKHTEAEKNTKDINTATTISPEIIDEITALMITLRRIKGYLGLALVSDSENVISEIPEGIEGNTVSTFLDLKDHVITSLNENWKEFSVDPIDILLTGGEIKIFLFQSLVEKKSTLSLCLFIDKKSSASMFQLQIRNFINRVKSDL